tara:strand:+ start:3661 stop:3840 length:180 start_codon:yes stop_codon:yes gene_type:complete
MAKENNMTVAQLILNFAIHIGMLPLTGTTNEKHMQQDLAELSSNLSDEQVVTIENIVNL